MAHSLGFILRKFIASTAVSAPLVFLSIPVSANSTGETPPIYQASHPNEQVGYARVIRLQHNGTYNGTLLATFEHWYTDTTPTDLIIEKSNDDGQTWSTLTTISEPNGWSIMYQPVLFELPQAMGPYTAGTILLVDNSLPSSQASTRFNLFSSTNRGASWSSATEIMQGGNLNTGIWEPFLMIDAYGDLMLYFSDERQSSSWAQFLGGYKFNPTRGSFDTSNETIVMQSSNQEISRP